MILKEYHLTNLTISWIPAIPYLFASIGMIVWARYVDQTGHRLINLAIACFLGAAGLVYEIRSHRRQHGPPTTSAPEVDAVEPVVTP